MPYLDPTIEAERLETACMKRAELIADGHLSVPQSSGYIAIMYSTECAETATDPELEEGFETLSQLECFQQEAEFYLGLYQAMGLRAEKIKGSTISDAEAVIKDEHCTDIIAIGNGSYGNMWFQGSHLTWWNISMMSDHLKDGSFFQRTCGHYRDGRLNVSLGTFLMNDQTLIYAPVGSLIEDQHPDESEFVQVYDKPNNDVADLKAIHAHISIQK